MQDGGRCGDMAAVCTGSSGGMAAAGQEDDAQTPGGQLIQIRRDPVRQRQWSQVSGGSCCPGVSPPLTVDDAYCTTPDLSPSFIC